MEDTREYIRFDEIEKLTELTKEQVLDAVEDGTFYFNAWIDLERAFAVGKDNTLLAQVSVKGVIPLNNQQSKKLLAGDLKVSRLSMIESLSITNEKSAASVFPNAKSGSFTAISKSPLSLDSIGYIATNVIAIPDINSIDRDKTDVNKAVHASEDKVSGLLSGLSSMFDSVSKASKVLCESPIGLKPSNIRLHKQSLSQYFNQSEAGLNTGLNTGFKPASSQVNQGLKPNVEIHPIKQIQERILEKYPETKSGEAWQLIRKDISTESYQLDSDMVIIEIGVDTLSYSEDDKHMSYRRFQNLFSEVRKKLHG